MLPTLLQSEHNVDSKLDTACRHVTDSLTTEELEGLNTFVEGVGSGMPPVLPWCRRCRRCGAIAAGSLPPLLPS